MQVVRAVAKIQEMGGNGASSALWSRPSILSENVCPAGQVARPSRRFLLNNQMVAKSSESRFRTQRVLKEPPLLRAPGAWVGTSGFLSVVEEIAKGGFAQDAGTNRLKSLNNLRKRENQATVPELATPRGPGIEEVEQPGADVGLKLIDSVDHFLAVLLSGR